jgi:RimJ/RimL family protein N-acetyltransferase
VLRPFRSTDVAAVLALANDPDIARNTINIPHPYEREAAEAWIGSQPAQWDRRKAVTFAVTDRESGQLLGAVGLILEDADHRAELGYWIGRPYWGRGFATEAAGAVIAWGFPALDLHRIHATHFPRNPASGSVLRKLGMSYEGRLREHVRKGDEYLDLECYALLRSELDRRPRDG